jgi:NADH-quinone oxidoreductase subunit N
MCLGNLSELFLAFIIIILIIIRIRTLNNIKSFNIILNFGIIGLIAELLVVMSTMSDTMPKFNLISAMVYTPISLYIKILICLFTIFIFFMMKDYFRYEKFFNPELPILMLMCIDGMFITLSSNDLMMTYLGLELQSLSIFTMAALQKHSNLSIEASVKYFFYGSCASGILLFGISLVYGSFGSINYSIIAKFFLIFATINTEIPLSVIYGMIFILAGLLFKLGIAPFHF